MMFGYGYGGGWPVWEIALMWIVMVAFVGLLACRYIRLGRRGPSGAVASLGKALGTRPGSWTSGWPAVKSTPKSTRSCGRHWLPGSTRDGPVPKPA